jgi:phosphate transport system substrate-binding protein
MLVYKDTDDVDTGKALANFLWWASHDGQMFGPQKGYVTLPAEVLIRVESLITSLTAGGSPAMKP